MRWETSPPSRRRCAVAVFVLLGALLAVLPASPATAEVYVGSEPALAWGVDGRVLATAIVGDTVIVGGAFSNAVSPTGQTVPRRNLAAFDLGSGALRTDWRADAGSAVRALVADGTDVYVGGSFGRIAGQVHHRIARINGSTGAVDPGFTGGADGAVRAIALDAASVYIGGTFTSVNGVSRTRLAKLEKATGALVTGYAANANNAVWGLAVNPAAPVLYAAGKFSSVNGVSRNGVAAVDSGSGAVRPVVFQYAARPTLGLDVNDDGTRLYGAGGTGGNAVAAWSTSTGSRQWRQVAMGDIQAVEHHRGTVYFGFHDGFQQDTTLKFLAADAATGLLEAGFRPSFNGFWGVFAIDVTDRGVAVGGDFTRVSGVVAHNRAWFPALSAPPPQPLTVRLTGTDTNWRYWDLDSRPAGWQTPAFDDSTWPSGRPQLGYGEGDEATVIGPSGSTKYITSYFRTGFELAELPDGAAINLLADDGALVWLNGIEVVRDNLPAGEITHSTRASSGRSGGEENAMRPFTIPVSALATGTNTLAVELHQEAPWTSDASFELDLIVEYAAETDPGT